MNEKDLSLYTKASFFIAAKFNEIHWPTMNEIFDGISLQKYCLIEYELLKNVDFKVPNPNHNFYIEILVNIFGLDK